MDQADTGALLEVLGNANRRRILRLLSRRPCYVSEIADVLDLSPKAVIDHLRRLERADLITSQPGDGRRKYFRITRTLRLEVAVSPYDFRARSERVPSGADGNESMSDDEDAATESIEMDLEIPASSAAGADGRHLGRELRRLVELDRDLSRAQRRVHRRLTGLLDAVNRQFDGADHRLHADLALAIGTRTVSTEELVRTVDASRDVVEAVLAELRGAGLVTRSEDGWRLPRDEE